MKWNRPSGTPIYLQDTKEMNKFATDNGWTKEARKTTKSPSKKAD